MANTKSAESRARNSARRREHNRSTKSRVRTVEANYLALITAGKKDEAAAAYRLVTSSLDKAAKTGVIPRARADRKKSRLAARLAALK